MLLNLVSNYNQFTWKINESASFENVEHFMIRNDWIAIQAELIFFFLNIMGPVSFWNELL